jgi:DNA-binding SARP family transcriptional activator
LGGRPFDSYVHVDADSREWLERYDYRHGRADPTAARVPKCSSNSASWGSSPFSLTVDASTSGDPVSGACSRCCSCSAISTASLADKLWPDDQPLSAIKTVQVYVSRLRDVLGPDAGRLSSTASGYRLAVADDEFDVARFEGGLRLAREASASGDQTRARATLEAALAEWSGPALGDMADERFGRSEADRLEELRLQAIEEMYQARIDVGTGREAIAELRGLVGDEPGRETLWRLLMLALYADGRQAEALEAYQDARRYLGDELGLDPSPELQELERAILNQEAPVPARRQPEPSAAPEKDVLADEPPSSAGGAPSPAQRRRRMVTVLRAGSGPQTTSTPRSSRRSGAVPRRSSVGRSSGTAASSTTSISAV